MDQLIALVEQWPDGTVEAYTGSTVDPGDLEIWSAARGAEARQRRIDAR